MKRKMLVIAGPTASGKSALAIEVARRLQGEVVCADSMQIYTGMDIGTAKVTREEMGGVPHHMLDICPPDADFTVAMYRARACRAIEEIIGRGKVPILCGGTGLYINALTKPMGLGAPPPNEAIRQTLTGQAELPGGRRALKARLFKVDPESGERLHENDVRRIVRALEIFVSTGKTMTQWNREDARKEPPFDTAIYAIDWPREVLYQRINARVEQMVAQGLEGEVRALLKRPGFAQSTAMQGLGYKEMAGYVRGEIGLSEAVLQIQMGSRRYAKRQLTWFRADSRVRWLPPGDTAELGAQIARAYNV